MNILVTYANGKQRSATIDEFNYSFCDLMGQYTLGSLNNNPPGFERFDGRPEIKSIQVTDSKNATNLTDEEAQVIKYMRETKERMRKNKLAEEIQEIVKPIYFSDLGPLITKISSAIANNGFVPPDFTIQEGIGIGESFSKLFLITDKWGISISLYHMESGRFEVTAYLT